MKYFFRNFRCLKFLFAIILKRVAIYPLYIAIVKRCFQLLEIGCKQIAYVTNNELIYETCTGFYLCAPQPDL